jgi:hypothetical protein
VSHWSDVPNPVNDDAGPENGDDAGDVLVAVTKAIAHAERASPEQLDYTLHDHVDTDALRALAARPDTNWELTFQVADHRETVTSAGASGSTASASSGRWWSRLPPASGSVQCRHCSDGKPITPSTPS